jgi:hypothetical protein
LDHVYNVAHYAITHEAAIKDGDTIGLADGWQVTARHLPSFVGDARNVVRLDFN